MFASPSTAFEFPFYAVRFVHQFAEAPSSSPTSTCPFNRRVLEFLDVEAEWSEDSE